MSFGNFGNRKPINKAVNQNVPMSLGMYFLLHQRKKITILVRHFFRLYELALTRPVPWQMLHLR